MGDGTTWSIVGDWSRKASSVIVVEQDDPVGEAELADAIQKAIEAFGEDADSTVTDRLDRAIRLATSGRDGPDEDDGPAGGVREPRRPLPGSDGDSGQQLTAEFGFD